MTIEFTYGTVAGGKTARMIIASDIDKFRGLNVLIIKPKLDDRDGPFIKTRFEEAKRECVLWDNNTTLEELIMQHGGSVDSIFIDEVQFLSEKQANEIRTISNLIEGINIQLYGLMTDFTGKLFEGTKLVLEMSDTLLEVPNKCWCKSKATKNAKLDESGIIVKKAPNGDTIDVGYHYVPLCSHHFHLGISKKYNK